jgi:hypothetical protein
MVPRVIVGVLLAAIILLPGPSTSAQVVREDGISTIAGILGGSYDSEVMFSFKSGGGEVIFASLSGELYQVNDEHDGHGEAMAAPAAEEGGGCSGEGGRARFCLQVVDAKGNPVCTAGRPTGTPGWQRDPRLACVIPNGSPSSTYWLRVAVLSHDGTCGEPGATLAGEIPFVLDVSLRPFARSGSQLHAAIAESGNRF